MKNSNEELSAELGALESQVTVLETQARARGLTVPTRPDVAAAKLSGATLDEIFTALGDMESHAAKLRVTTRLATPLAYSPRTSTNSGSLSTSQQIVAAGGVKVIGLKDEIARFEAMLPGATGKTKAGFESKLAGLRSELSSITQGK